MKKKVASVKTLKNHTLLALSLSLEAKTKGKRLYVLL
jgi:hypothetical protein